jgi:two-component system, NtrC family, sensor histidine kinase PilS
MTRTAATERDSRDPRDPLTVSGNGGDGAGKGAARAARRVALAGTPLRLLRLLALYRGVAALALALAGTVTNLSSVSFAAALAYAVWALLSVAALRRFKGSLPGLLLAQLATDLVFIAVVFIDTHNPITSYATYLYPILAAHGWFMRDRMAFGHAALATIVLLLAELLMRSGTLQSFSQAALVGAGYFLLTGIGVVLGGSAQESERKVVSRTADVRRLAHINQVIISELVDGVLVIGAMGQIVMANPQALRWLGTDEATMQGDTLLSALSPELDALWRTNFVGGSTQEGAPLAVRTPDGTRLLTPRMMPVDLEQRAGTLIFLEDIEQAEAQAQQIKLAALGRLSASIAHEIRNPLSAIKQAAQLIGEEVSHSAEARALTAMIDKNVDRIDRIVRDVSLLGRRDRGSPASIEITSVINELTDELTVTLGAPRDGFYISVPSLAMVYVDRSHFDEMLVNLMSNAWRHASKGTHSVKVSLTLNDEMQRAIVSVIDDGPGVKDEIADKIFEPFFSGSGSTGLGLYLVRELALANGGSVRLGASEHGARFVLELPLPPKQMQV